MDGQMPPVLGCDPDVAAPPYETRGERAPAQPLPAGRPMFSLFSLTSLLLRPSHGPATAAVALRRARPLACAAATQPNVAGMRKEADRLLARAYKKTAKANERAAACERKEEALMAAADPSLEELESLPNCAELRAAAEGEASRLARCACFCAPAPWLSLCALTVPSRVGGRLRALVDGLAAVKGAGDERVAELVEEAEELGVGDTPPERPAPRPKKPKGPRRQGPRVPYRTFKASAGAEVRVGRSAKDNDRLSHRARVPHCRPPPPTADVAQAASSRACERSRASA